jgi:predicted small secreted protein
MRKSLTIIVLSLLVLFGAAALLSACNTTAGVGQDISATGNALTRGAEQSRPRY